MSDDALKLQLDAALQIVAASSEIALQAASQDISDWVSAAIATKRVQVELLVARGLLRDIAAGGDSDATKDAQKLVDDAQATADDVLNTIQSRSSQPSDAPEPVKSFFAPIRQAIVAATAASKKIEDDNNDFTGIREITEDAFRNLYESLGTFEDECTRLGTSTQHPGSGTSQALNSLIAFKESTDAVAQQLSELLSLLSDLAADPSGGTAEDTELLKRNFSAVQSLAIISESAYLDALSSVSNDPDLVEIMTSDSNSQGSFTDDNGTSWDPSDKSIGDITLVTSDLAYGIKKADGSVVKITLNGQFASDNYPGAGWKAVAVALSKSDTQYELIWKNSAGQYASWKLNLDGSFIKGDLLSKAGLLSLEDEFENDLNDDSTTGWTFDDRKTVGQVTLVTSDLAYGIKKADGSVVKITLNGQFASDNYPGAGWKAVAVALSKSDTQYELIWKNSAGQYASWKLNLDGSFIKGDLLSKAGLLSLEDEFENDLNDDSTTGWTFDDRKTVGQVTLVTSDLAYGIKKADGSVVKITLNGQFASDNYPGAGWKAVAVALSKSDTQYELIWKNSAGQYASWKLNLDGSFIKGDLLSKAGLLSLEDEFENDLNDDSTTGWTFDDRKTVGQVTLVTSDLAYGIKKADGSVVNITLNGQFASDNYPGAGWKAVAVALSKSDTQYELIWKNSAGQYASWKLNLDGSFIKGDLLSKAGLLSLEDEFENDLNDDSTTGWTFDDRKTVGQVTLVTSDLAYGIKKADGSVVKITLNGQFASDNYPGAGWKAVAVALSKSDTQYELIWKNSAGQYASWKLNLDGSFIKGDLLSKAGLLSLEDEFENDLNDDSTTGWTFDDRKTVGQVTLVTSDLAYGIKKADGSVVKITLNGQFASDNYPGAGWKAVAVALSKSDTQYELIWKNSAGQYASWKLNLDGSFIKGDLLSKAGLLSLEDEFENDLNDDSTTGWTFDDRKTVGQVTLVTSDLAYGIKKADGSVVKITLNGQFASDNYPGAGWKAVAVALSKSDTQYELIWKNSAGQYASWKLNLDGSFIKGDLLSKAGLLSLEDEFENDLNDDSTTGWTFDDRKTVGQVTLVTSDLAYGIKKADGSVVKITLNGQFASDNYPGAGWKAVAVALSKSDTQYELIWKNSAGQYASWKLNLDGSFIKGDLLSESALQLSELEAQADFNDDGRIGSFLKREGSNGASDNLTANTEDAFNAFYGRGGDDTFTSNSDNLIGFDLMIGETGNDKYITPSGKSALIAETGNDNSDELIAPGIKLSRSNIATIEGGRHLAVNDPTTHSSFFIYDWLKTANKIETFKLDNGAGGLEQISFTEFKNRIAPSAGPAPEDLTWSEWDLRNGFGHLTHLGITSNTSLAKLTESYLG